MIDSHHHLWNFDQDEFSWLEPSLRKSFLAADLESTLAETGVTASIAVQARCSLEENDFLSAQAEETDLIKGIVGWADLSAKDVEEVLERLVDQPLIKGVREITQGTPDDQFLTNGEFNRGVSLLAERGLSYDLLIFENQLDVAKNFVAQHGNLAMVMDHCAKPSVCSEHFPKQWAKGLAEIAKYENLYCKLSGLVTEVRDGSECKAELFRPYFDTVLEAFGPSRIMFGSDWPVSLGAASYNSWLDTVFNLTNKLSEDEREMIFYSTAEQFYKI